MGQFRLLPLIFLLFISQSLLAQPATLTGAAVQSADTSEADSPEADAEKPSEKPKSKELEVIKAAASYEDAVLAQEEDEFQDSLHRDTPRGAMIGFVEALKEEDFDKAAEFLDLRYLPRGMSADNGPEYAVKLSSIIQRHLWINFQELSNDPAGILDDGLSSYRDLLGQLQLHEEKINLYLQRVPDKQIGKVWKVSNATVAQIPKLYEHFGYSPLAEWLIPKTPNVRVLGIYIWEWVLIVGYFVVAFSIVSPLIWLAKKLVIRSSYHLSEELLVVLSGPVRFMMALLLMKVFVPYATLSALALALISSAGLLILATVWLALGVTSMVQLSLQKRWLENGNTQSTHLLRPLSNMIRVLVIGIGILMWFKHLGFDPSTILAGLGIGGIAIALAAKQSIENFIGTITLYSAAPVKVGDVCSFGGRRGTVEEIGLRSTRIRTLDRSVIYIPNARFAEMELENISEREKIRLQTDIRLHYSTTPAQLKAINAEILESLEKHEMVAESPLRVRFKGFGEHGLEINVLAYITTKSFPEYQGIAEEINFDIMETVQKHGARLVPVAPTIAPSAN